MTSSHPSSRGISTLEGDPPRPRSVQGMGMEQTTEENRTLYALFTSFLHFFAILRLRMSTLERVQAEPIPHPKPSAIDAALYVGFPMITRMTQCQTHEDKGEGRSYGKTGDRIYAKATSVLDPRLLTEGIDSRILVCNSLYITILYQLIWNSSVIPITMLKEGNSRRRM